MNSKSLIFYAELICRKLDLHVDAFLERIEAIQQGDKNQAEFIEEMMLKPLDHQTKYLADKVIKICRRSNDERSNRSGD